MQLNLVTAILLGSSAACAEEFRRGAAPKSESFREQEHWGLDRVDLVHVHS
jgi:hypothetical protein